MATSAVKDTFFSQFDRLPNKLQLRVLDFVKTLKPKGIKGKNLLRFEGGISPDDLQVMSKVIGENCERVDINEW